MVPVRKRHPRLFKLAARKTRFPPTLQIQRLRSLNLAVHLTARDGGNAEGLQEQSLLTARDGGNAQGLQEQSLPCTAGMSE